MTAISRNLVSRLDHAAYLGRELARAEHALTSGETLRAGCCTGRCQGEELRLHRALRLTTERRHLSHCLTNPAVHWGNPKWER
jgi:Domain of unknown function (DUF4346)